MTAVDHSNDLIRRRSAMSAKTTRLRGYEAHILTSAGSAFKWGSRHGWIAAVALCPVNVMGRLAGIEPSHDNLLLDRGGQRLRRHRPLLVLGRGRALDRRDISVGDIDRQYRWLLH